MNAAHVSLAALALSFGTAAACTTERVIVIKEPASEKSSLAADAGSALAVEPGSTGPSTMDTPIVARPDEDGDWGIREPQADQDYARVLSKVGSMVTDTDLQRRVHARNLSLVNVMWEDTGRAQGSSLGPNISDFTLQVRRKDEAGRFHTSLMPVIRYPNFTDRTGDIPADRFFVRVGNEHGTGLRSFPLTEVLRNIKTFSSRPETILGDGNLLAPRDTHFLVSAQAVFLPIPKSGKAQFNPALFNYQSAPGSPAVLTIVVTRQGSSIQVIENKPGEVTGSGYGQELYFNNNGQRAALTAERRSDVAARIEAKGGPSNDDEKSALQKGADVLFLVQVPLKHKNRGVLGGASPPADMPFGTTLGAPSAAAPAKPKASMSKGSGESEARSDVEQAVLGHGPNVGPYREGSGIRLERDPKFPIRITVQFYKATSNGVASDIDLDSIAKSIGSVYEHADAVGSLVMPEGDPRRPTAWQKVPHEWFPW